MHKKANILNGKVGNCATSLKMAFPPASAASCANNTVITGTVAVDGTAVQPLKLTFVVAS